MSEIKKCAFSGKEFPVSEGDLAMYRRLSPTIGGKLYLIPPPRLCRLERDRRRAAFRNERRLHKRVSSLSGKPIISFFAANAPFKVYMHDEWWSDGWDAMDYGRDFDFARPFFDQFFVLQLEVPRPPLVNNKAENSDYCNFADANKNCYLITSANRNVDSFYSWIMADNKDVVDSLNIFNCELMYQCVDCNGCYNLRYAQNCENCRDSGFLLGCNGLANCLFCVNLKNKSYHIFNKPCGKEVYEKFMAELDGGSERYDQALAKFEQLKKDFPMRKANNFVGCENVSGNNIFSSKNIHQGFDVYDSEDCRYLHYGLKAKNCSDICYFDGTELCYESTSLIGYGYRFTVFCRDSAELFYCDNCHACKNCFGCVGLRNKQYCIFNKQYSREEYEKLAGKIIEVMTANREWGEFFPVKYSLFPYNETIAHEESPVNKEKAMSLGWRWQEEEKNPESAASEKALICGKTGKQYRVIAPEEAFYRKMKFPMPRLCPEQRLRERILLRTPRELWQRNCAGCGVAVETAYAPGRPERIYCEKCYLAEVY